MDINYKGNQVQTERAVAL